RTIDEFMPIAIVALDGEECIAFHQGSTVDGNSMHGRRQSTGAFGVHYRNQFIQGPKHTHATLPCNALATASWSENGTMRSPMICPVSWPLPAITSTSPFFRSAIALWMASARSPISVSPAASARIGAPMAPGFSLLGIGSAV